MKKLAAPVLLLCFWLNLLPASAADYVVQKADAEKFFAEKSFAKALEIYAAVNITNLPPAEQRWVLFRRADTQWRSEASTQRADNTKVEQASRANVAQVGGKRAGQAVFDVILGW